jgi:hypothetical protein
LPYTPKLKPSPASGKKLVELTRLYDAAKTHRRAGGQMLRNYGRLWKRSPDLFQTLLVREQRFKAEHLAIHAAQQLIDSVVAGAKYCGAAREIVKQPNLPI